MGCSNSQVAFVADENSYSGNRYWHRIRSEQEAKSSYEADGSINSDSDRSKLELRALLDYPIGRQFLLESSRTLTVEKYLNGWIDIQSYNGLADGQMKNTLARSIFKKYVAQNSLVGPEVVKKLKEKTSSADNLPSGLFNDVKLLFFDQVHDGLFLRMRPTENYQRMCAAIRRKYNRANHKDFRYHQLIGQGGFGLVAEVSKKSTGARYAMKLQRKDHLSFSYGREPWRADLEKRAFASCRHPFIVELFFAFQTETLLAMVTTLGTGRDLSKILKINGPLSVAQVRFYSAEVTSALSYLHSKGFVYRDLKPGNILLNMDGHIQLVDFGGVHDTNGKLIGACITEAVSNPFFVEQESEKHEHPLSSYWKSITMTPSTGRRKSSTSSAAAAIPRAVVLPEIDGNNALLTFGSGPDYRRLLAQYTGDPAVFLRLREEFQDVNEGKVLRHLLACKGDYEKTVAHIEECLRWRMRTLASIDIPHHSSAVGGCWLYLHGFDVRGHPLIVVNSRFIKWQGRDIDQQIRWMIYVLELAIQRMPPHVEQITALGNRVGNDASADLAITRRIFSVIEKYYPNRVFELLIYPISVGYKAIGGIIKSIAASQASIIHFVESLDELRKHIPDEYIPAEMGGSCTYKFDMKDYPPAIVCQPYERFKHETAEPEHGASSIPERLSNSTDLGQPLENEDSKSEGSIPQSLRANSIVGTYSYMAPEMVLLMVKAEEFKHTGYTKAVDWWSLGVTIYRLLTGEYPFKTDIPKPTTPEAVLTEGSDRYNALLEPVNYSRFEEHTDAVDIVSQLLTVSDKERLGYGPSGSTAVSAHRFFRDLNWVELEEKKSAPPPLPPSCVPHRTFRGPMELEDMLTLYKRREWLDGSLTGENETALKTQLKNWDYTSASAVLMELKTQGDTQDSCT